MRSAIPWLSSLLLHGLCLSGLFLLARTPPELPLRLSLDFELIANEAVAVEAPEPAPTPPPAPQVPVSEPAPVPDIQAAKPADIKPPPEPEPLAAADPAPVAEPAAPTRSSNEIDAERAAQYAQTVEHVRGLVLRKLRYPTVARRQGWQGKSVLSFILCADGSVEELQVYASSGYKLLDHAAMKAVMESTPFRGNYLRTRVQLPISFILN